MPLSHSDALPSAIPDHHFEALSQLENGYWWYVGRLEWAKRLIARHLGRHRFVFYADIGCGTGGFAKNLRKAFGNPRTALVDKHPEALRHVLAEETGVEVIDEDITKGLALPFRPEVITLMDVLEHIEDDRRLLKHLFECLPPSGLLVLSVPAHQLLYSAWDQNLGHHRRYSRTELVEKVRASGLTVREVHHMWSFLFPMAPWRKFRAARQSSLEFPAVSKRVNRLLILLSRAEWWLSRVVRLPFGTSLILVAEKL